MKYITSIILLVCLAVSALGQENPYHYYYKGQKQYLAIDSTAMLIQTNDVSFDKLKNDYKSEIASLEQSKANGIQIVTLVKKHTKDSFKKLSENIKKSESVRHTSPLFVDRNGKRIGALSNQIIVKIKQSTNIPDFEHLLNQTNVTIIKGNLYGERIYLLEMDKNNPNNSLEIANYYHETGLFEYSEPNFYVFIEGSSANNSLSNDPFFSQQYYLQGNSSFGIDAVGGWGITKGCNSIKIAVVDSGVELEHPDLQANLLPGFDVYGSSQGGNTENYPHGTMCAGIIVAVENNIGIIGVAPNCKIIPIRLWPKSTVPTLENIGLSITTASDYGADVINCSFAEYFFSDHIENAINYATTSGRNGLGCVVVFASDNRNYNYLPYTASLSKVIAVGATYQDDRYGDSNYGTGLDVVAPGVGIFSTDLQSTQGYNTNSGEAGDYAFDEGTSFAAPQVAALAALILSVNPNLSYVEVKQIIESTCTKIGGYTYTLGAGENPNLTWNNEVGYGRINVRLALEKAMEVYQITSNSYTSPDFVCTGGTTFQIPYLPAGMSASWSVEGSGIYIGSIYGTGNNTMAAYSNGNYNGWATVSVVINTNTSCGQMTFTKQVWVGLPNGSGGASVNIDYLEPCENYMVLGAHVYPWGNSGVNNYLWYDASGNIVGDQQQYFAQIVSPNYPYQNYEVFAYVQNPCGLAFVGGKSWETRPQDICSQPPPDGCDGFVCFTLAPNPTQGELYIEAKNSSDNKTNNGVVLENVTILNSDGQPVLNLFDTQLPHKVNLSHLKEGIYLVVYQHKKKTFHKRILLKK